MLKGLRWGVAGCGRVSSDFAYALRCVPGAEVTGAAVSAGESAAQRVNAFAAQHSIPQRYQSYSDLFAADNVDVVYIGTYHTTHADLAVEALEAGKHVVCEKPLSVNAGQVRDVLAAADANDRFLMEGMWTRFFPAMVRLEALVRGGAIGEVVAAHGDFGVRMPADVARMWDVESGGGCLLDLGIYPLAFVSACFGGAVPRGINAGGSVDPTTGVDLWTSLMLDYGDGKHGVVSTTMVADTPESWTVTGTEGRITVHPPGHSPTGLTVTVWGPDGDARGTDAKTYSVSFDGAPVADGASFFYPGSEGFVYEAAAAQTAIQAGFRQHPRMPATESLLLAEIMDEARRQIGQRYPVDPPSGSFQAPADSPSKPPSPAAGRSGVDVDVDVVVAGLGLPGRGMGWTHMRQVMDSQVPGTRPAGIVEPFFLAGAGAGDASFQPFVDECASRSIATAGSFSDPALPTTPGITVIAGRTADNPELFLGALALGSQSILLEKPGAPSVDDLATLQSLADLHSTTVAMGFHKHFAPTIHAASAAMRTAGSGSEMTLLASNTFTPDTLAECFSRNAEGLCKNMLIHELALLVDFENVTVDRITDVIIDPEGAPFTTEVMTLDGITDLSRLAITLVTTDGNRYTVCATRCAPDDVSTITVADPTGSQVFDSEAMDVAPSSVTPQHPIDMAYLHSSWSLYADLKTRMAEHVAGVVDTTEPSRPTVPDAATLETGIKALNLADLITSKVMGEEA